MIYLLSIILLLRLRLIPSYFITVLFIKILYINNNNLITERNLFIIINNLVLP